MKLKNGLVNELVTFIANDRYVEDNAEDIIQAFAIRKSTAFRYAIDMIKDFFSGGRDQVLAHIRQRRPGMEEILRYIYETGRSYYSTLELVERFHLELDARRHVPKMLLFLCQSNYYYSYRYSSEKIVSDRNMYLPLSLLYYFRYLFADFESQPEAAEGSFSATYGYENPGELTSFISDLLEKRNVRPSSIVALTSSCEFLKHFEKELKLPQSGFWKPYKVSPHALALYFALMAKYPEYGYYCEDILDNWSGEDIDITNGEADVVLRHLKIKRTSYCYDEDSFSVAPLNRKLLVGLLRDLPDPDAWYLVDELQRVYRLSGFRYSAWLGSYFRDGSISSNVIAFTDSKGLREEKSIYSSEMQWRDVLDRNIDLFFGDASFRALFYMFSLFGIVELYEEEPEKKVLLENGKEAPFTPYSAAKAVRLTPYGKWLFGYAGKPERKKSEYEVLADDDLLIVTFRGSNLKVSSVLDKLAIPVGPLRYKVTKASFLKDIHDLKAFKEREKAFRALFAKELPANWNSFLSELEGTFRRTALFKCAQVVTLPDPSLVKPFLEDRTFRSLFLLTEGGRLVVLDEKRDKAEAYLLENGIAVADDDI